MQKPANLHLIFEFDHLNVSHRIDGIKGPLMECNDMADKLTSSIFNKLSYVYWLGLQGQLANLVVPNHLRISRLIYSTGERERDQARMSAIWELVQMNKLLD